MYTHCIQHLIRVPTCAPQEFETLIPGAQGGQASSSLERRSDEGGNERSDAGLSGANVPKVDVPANAFVNDKGHKMIPEMLVRTQHAPCDEAQCPRAKVNNVG